MNVSKSYQHVPDHCHFPSHFLFSFVLCLFLYCIVGEAKHASIKFRSSGKISYLQKKAITARNNVINCERSGFLFSSIPQ